MTSTTAQERFWAKVAGPDANGCWLWQHCTSHGYGSFVVDGKKIRAHRYSYERLVGPIPDGLTLDHLCHVKACVNPAHLEPVTQGENVLRGIGCVAQNARKTHCGNGHLLEGDNLLPYDRSRGRRMCKTCRNANQRLYRQRRKLQRISGEGRPQ